MSRIGRKPIQIPQGVTVTVGGRSLEVSGPKGTQSMELAEGLSVSQEGEILNVTKVVENPSTQEAYGLTRTLIDNMVTGVSKGFERQLEINGVGYRAAVAGDTINLSLGYSHPIAFKLPEGVSAKTERNLIILSGANKQMVGQVAANLRALRKPEPYKGKGIKYVEEQIRRKAGKTATKG